MSKNNNINLNENEHSFRIDLYSKKENPSIIKYINNFKISISEFKESFSLFLKSSINLNTITHMLMLLKINIISSCQIKTIVALKSIKKTKINVGVFFNTKTYLKMVKKMSMVSSNRLAIGKYRILSLLDNLSLGGIDNNTLGFLDYGDSIILLMTKRLLPNENSSSFVTIANFNLYKLTFLSDYDSHTLSYMDSNILGDLDKIII